MVAGHEQFVKPARLKDVGAGNGRCRLIAFKYMNRRSKIKNIFQSPLLKPWKNSCWLV